MKRFIRFAVAGAAAFGITTGLANASDLTVTQAPPGIKQAAQGVCIMGDTSSVGIIDSNSCDAVFDPNDAVQTLSSPEYTVAQIVALVGTTFAVGIDVNQGGQTVQILESFMMEVNDVSGMLGFQIVDMTTGSNPLNFINNGNGDTDMIIMTFNLAGYAMDDLVRFTASLSALSDGREQFFLLDLDDIPEVPVPAAIWLMGAGLAGLGFASRKKKAA